MLHIQNVVDIGATERIDRLGIVAHNAEMPVLSSKLLYDEMLGTVGVLILIDQHIAEILLVEFKHIGMVAEEDVGIDQQIVLPGNSGSSSSGR